MQQYFFYLPFAEAGDKATIPVTVQTNNSISYPEGYGAPYADNLATNPAALAIDRETFNQLMFAITQNLQNYQEYGFPEFIDSSDNQGTAFAYDVGAICRYSATGTAPFTTFISLVTNNTTTPVNDGIHWAEIGAFTNGSNSHGYWRKAPDGYIEQWGVVSVPSSGGVTTTTFTLPIPFQTLHQVCIANFDGTAPPMGGLAGYNLNLTEFQITVNTATESSGLSVAWMSKGF